MQPRTVGWNTHVQWTGDCVPLQPAQTCASALLLVFWIQWILLLWWLQMVNKSLCGKIVPRIPFHLHNSRNGLSSWRLPAYWPQTTGLWGCCLGTWPQLPSPSCCFLLSHQASTVQMESDLLNAAFDTINLHGVYTLLIDKYLAVCISNTKTFVH